MNNVIEALKKNDKPFGLMTKEMQAKAQSIGQFEFSMYMKDGTWVHCGDCDNFQNKIVTDQTYRLRSDYEEKPKVIECEVRKQGGHLHYCDGGTWFSLHEAIDRADFIGFKYDDNTQDIHNGVRLYKFNDRFFDEISSDHILTGKAEVLTPTHVLFREVK